MKLNIRAFALTCGLYWGIALFLATWWLIAFYGASPDPTIIGRFYPGYSITPLGSVLGLIWGSLDGLIGGAIFAWLYNLITTKLTSQY
jgi:hypothetical protein